MEILFIVVYQSKIKVPFLFVGVIAVGWAPGLFAKAQKTPLLLFGRKLQWKKRRPFVRPITKGLCLRQPAGAILIFLASLQGNAKIVQIHTRRGMPLQYAALSSPCVLIQSSGKR